MPSALSRALAQATESMEELAKDLRLTPFQVRFAEELAKDPDRNQTQAYIRAGGSEKVARSQASRLAAHRGVRRYFDVFTAQARLAAHRKVKGSIATLAEALRVTSTAMRSRPGQYLTEQGALDLEKVRNAPKGAIVALDLARGKIRTSDPVRAADQMIRYHTGDYAREELAKRGPQVNLTVNLAALSEDELWQLRALRAKVVAGSALPEGGEQER